MDPEPLVLTLSFPPPPLDGVQRLTGPDLMDASTSTCSVVPTALVSWGFGHEDGGRETGVAMGCADGSVFIWSANQATAEVKEIKKNDLLRHSASEHILRLTSGKSGHGLGVSTVYPSIAMPTKPNPRTKSRSPSLSSTRSLPQNNSHSPTRLTRGIATTSLSNEQVNAPTTYVDYDDEPGKLKELLARPHREGGAAFWNHW